MPKPAPTISDEDIRRKYYESSGYSTWITEMQLDPLQLVVADDTTGKHFRVPVTLNSGQLSFGDPIEVFVQYADAPVAKASAIVWASRADSLDGIDARPPVDYSAVEVARPKDPIKSVPNIPGEQAPSPDFAKGGHVTRETPAQATARIHAAAQRAASETPAASSASGPTHTEGAVNMPFDRDKIREALGLGPDATQDQINEAWAAANAPASAETAASKPAPEAELPPDMTLSALAALADKLGVKMIDPGQLQTMRQMAARGQAAYDAQRRNERDGIIVEALQQGKIALSRKEHWEKSWDADPEGTRAMLAGLAPNMVPMEADGYSNAVATSEAEQRYYTLYPEDAPKGARR